MTHTLSASRPWTSRVFIATSVDGFIAGPDGDISWLEAADPSAAHAPAREDAAAVTDYETFMASVDTLVMGRATYEKVLTFGFWPYPDHRVIVLSSTLAEGDDRIRLVRSLPEAFAALSESTGVYLDGGALIRGFLAADLVDEITITRVPIILGSGISLFGADSPRVHLDHLGTAVSGNGMTHSTYKIRRSGE